MLHAENPEVRALLLDGNFGLEKESLRVDEHGFLAHTAHPFPDDDHIVRDFCENQTEINTPVVKSVHEAIQSLDGYYHRIQRKLAALPEREYLWPFSNPPYIRDESDIPIAQFKGGKSSKTEYRNYLSDRYGRYKMSFSGIHVNFSFSDALLQKDFAVSGEEHFEEYKNQLYVTLAERSAAYGWLLVAVTAASPLMDSSFVEQGIYDRDTFSGMASSRCSEMGYWNFFAPILNYHDIRSYADSIQHYVDLGLLRFPTELYYPVRLKPAGSNNLNTLRRDGVNHIELRMFDLNPLVPCGVEEKDVIFAHLFLVWLASTPGQPFSHEAQVQAVQNFKNADGKDC
jgi:glutamate--cysteine ligase